MKRKKKSVIACLLAIMLMAGLLVGFAASPAAADPPYACDENLVGRRVTYQGVVWECMETGFGGASWVPIGQTRRRNYALAAYDHGIWGFTWVGSTIATNTAGNHFGGSQVWATQETGAIETHGPGTLRTRARVERWNGSRWVLCNSNSWSTNTVTQANWASSVSMGTVPDCGSGTYSTIGISEKNIFGNWFGAFNQSLGIYMTNTSPAAAGDAPAVDGG